jgi:hypothetical protein
VATIVITSHQVRERDNEQRGNDNFTAEALLR